MIMHIKKISIVVTVLFLIGCGETSTSQLNEPFPVVRSGPHGMEFSFIPKGHFRMGSPEEEDGRSVDEALHWVEITEDYWVQTTEVTRGQWFAVTGYYPKVCGPVIERNDYPVTCITWKEIGKFITKLNKQAKNDGYHYRLPTEAEWEYAARAYTETPYSFDEGFLDSYGWYNENSRGQLHPVAQLAVNGFDLYDVQGNVAEWVFDMYDQYPVADNYQDAIQDPKVSSSASKMRIVRGGARFNNELGCRLARRGKYSISAKDSNFGFRLVRVNL